MKNTISGLLAIFLVFSCSIACALPNPAAVNCTKNNLGYALINNHGICLFDDNSYCEEWAYFRGECSQGKNKFPGGAFDSQKLNQYCISQDHNTTQVTFCNQEE